MKNRMSQLKGRLHHCKAPCPYCGYYEFKGKSRGEYFRPYLFIGDGLGLWVYCSVCGGIEQLNKTARRLVKE